jgi:hypothetical protein
MLARTTCPREATSRYSRKDRIRYYAHCASDIHCTIPLLSVMVRVHGKYGTYCLIYCLGTNMGRLWRDSLLVWPPEPRDGYFGPGAAAALHRQQAPFPVT